LQATLGPAAGVGFGGSPAAELGTRSAAEFEQHVERVAKLWGRRLVQSRVVFLAGSDVLQRPLDDVLAFLAIVGRTFPIESKTRRVATERADDEDRPRFDGVHTFLDNFAAPTPDRTAWRELAARGLLRISLGVESGDPEVRKVYSKTWNDDELRATVSAAKAAGIGVSVLTLVGAGGTEFAESHVKQTAQLIESLELGAGDFVFLLDENEIRDKTVESNGLSFLQGPSWTEQQAKLKESLAPIRKMGVKVLPYTLEKQWA
jgi:radical SAM superfamily enzyme YgiQ (UPF0313 family)